jgi:hypothetical protein
MVMNTKKSIGLLIPAIGILGLVAYGGGRGGGNYFIEDIGLTYT